MTYHLKEQLIDLGRKARDANHVMFKVSSQCKNKALKRIGEVIWEKKSKSYQRTKINNV